jgi:hypothetical protein
MLDTLFEVQRQWYCRRCSKLASAFMVDVLGNTSYQWQKDIIAHMAMIPIEHSGIECGRILLVTPAGGGKSSVRDVYSLMNARVLLTISPLLSLGADQEEKLKVKAKQEFGHVCPIHMDEFRSIPEQKKMVS